MEHSFSYSSSLSDRPGSIEAYIPVRLPELGSTAQFEGAAFCHGNLIVGAEKAAGAGK